MKPIFDVVQGFYEQVHGRTVNKPAPPFFRQHIFHSILEYCSRGETEAHRLDMMYRFDQFEKCVASVKRREPRLTRHWLAGIHRRELALTTATAGLGMESLYHPAIALYEYFEGNHAAALTHLDVSLHCFDALFDDGLDDAVFGMVEQNLNRVRVLIAAGRHQESIEATCDIMDFLCAEQGGATYRGQRLSVRCSADERYSLSAHYIDELLIKFIVSDRDGLADALLFALCEKSGAWLSSHVKHAFTLLRQLRSAQCRSVYVDADVCAIDFAKLPFSVQYVLVKTLQAHPVHALSEAHDLALTGFLALSPAHKRMKAARWHPADPLRGQAEDPIRLCAAHGVRVEAVAA